VKAPITQADAIRLLQKAEHKHDVLDRSDRVLTVAAVIILVLATAYFTVMIAIGLLR